MPRERPATLLLEPDGTTLEQVIGELQSEWGVPQYPQEFRITLKVAEERDRAERTAPADAPVRDAAAAARAPAIEGGPKREKAPSLRSAGEPGGAREAAPGRRRRRGRRRRKRGGGSPGGSEGGGGASS